MEMSTPANSDPASMIIIRSYAAVGREFPFPIDLQDEVDPRDALTHSQGTLQHVDATFPMLFKQQEILMLLNEDR